MPIAFTARCSRRVAHALGAYRHRPQAAPKAIKVKLKRNYLLNCDIFFRFPFKTAAVAIAPKKNVLNNVEGSGTV